MLLGVGTQLALKLISSHHKNGSRIVSDQRTIQVVDYLSGLRVNRDFGLVGAGDFSPAIFSPARRGMLIGNKYKRSKKADNKKDAARNLRRLHVESRMRNSPQRHNQNACPVCGNRIGMTASGGRRKHSCSQCGATLNKQLICGSCNTNRVWQGKQGTACRGCGARYRRNAFA